MLDDDDCAVAADCVDDVAPVITNVVPACGIVVVGDSAIVAEGVVVMMTAGMNCFG